MSAEIKNPFLRKLAVIGGVIVIGPLLFFDHLACHLEPGFWERVRFAWRGGR
jgi:hypothetical protein